MAASVNRRSPPKAAGMADKLPFVDVSPYCICVHVLYTLSSGSFATDVAFLDSFYCYSQYRIYRLQYREFSIFHIVAG